MAKYAVTVHFHGSTVITVEADNPEQAEDIAAELWENCEEGDLNDGEFDWQRATVAEADPNARITGLSPTEIERLKQAEEMLRQRDAAAQAVSQ